MSEQRHDMDWVWAFLIALVLIIAMHQPGLSIQSIFVGSRTASFTQMALLKFLSGLVTSLIIFGVCAAIMMRRPSQGMIWGAAITQLLYLEIEWGFSLAFTDLGELMIRFAEELGILVSAIVALIVLRIRPRTTPTQNADI